ncbi:MAG TPA: TonB-dependent receptor plug domain-containing protein [Gemmatimonadaceae bacterium]|nr:TonB-dependent receptor plug domain-containing protein [Gemmatimonadaceae bacterium]
MSSNARVALVGGLLASLSVGCIGNTPPPVNDMPDPSPTRPLVGTVVTSDDIDVTPDQPIEKTLQARVAGVTIVTTPDGGIAVRIRGATTINGENQPLYVIDGMPIQPGPSGSLVGINPHDIASIEVLKDAASLAFYGVRAANGVILIKTKHAN